MADDSGFKAKSLKRKNVKGLCLAAAQAPAPPTPDEQLAKQFSTLEIGVEFKLDLRAEDLKTLHELGAGNGGTVSKVMHVATQKIMAKKVIHVDAKPAVRKQILRELHIMHECQSPYIVSFYGAFLNEGDVVMCMEYMDCGSLDSIAKKVGPMRIDVLGKIAEAVVGGLNYLYSEHRILHRDVKPSNVLVNSRGSIKLCDFGVSGELINSIADTFVGTSTYMSPERIKGAQYSVKSDVWSLGLTLLELAIGRFPFDTDGSSAGTRASAGPMGILDLLQKIVNEPAPRLPKNKAFPLSLEKMIDHCLIKDPEERPSPEKLLEEDFMKAARCTNVDLEAWSMSILDAPRRESLVAPNSLPRHVQQPTTRPSPAPPRDRGSFSNQGGREAPRVGSQPRISESRRGSQASVIDSGRPSDRQHTRANSRPRPLGESGEWDGGYERRGSRNGLASLNGDNKYY